MTTGKRIVLVVLACILAFAAGYFARYGVYERKPCSPPDTVVSQKSSPDGMVTAFILREDASESYYVAIEKKGGARLIADADFVPPRGYHPPIFTLSWNDAGDEVNIEIDYDFGDNNLLYRFDMRTLKLSNLSRRGAEHQR